MFTAWLQLFLKKPFPLILLNLNTQFCLFLFILLAHTFFLLCCKVETESLHDGLFQFYQLNGV